MFCGNFGICSLFIYAFSICYVNLNQYIKMNKSFDIFNKSYMCIADYMCIYQILLTPQ